MKVDLINYMGDDLTVVNAARVSMDKESDWDWVTHTTAPDKYGLTYELGDSVLKEADAKLIKYLAKHNHFTPFTHATITLRETVPIFVARQRFKHTVGFTYNEISRRYVDSDPEFYTPSVWRKRAENVKQGSSDEEALPADCVGIEDHHSYCLSYYRDLLDSGVCPEQARMVLPQSMYTSYYVTGSLYAFARAYLLRSDPHAQREIQEVAKLWDKEIRPLFPVSWSNLVDPS